MFYNRFFDEDYFEISVGDNGKAEIRMVFYRIRKQKQFIRYLENLGVEEVF